MALSVDSPENAAKMRESTEADFDVLSDPEGRMLDAFGVRHSGGGPSSGDIAQSASFLIDPEGEVVWRRIAENYRVRPKPAEILEAADRHLASGS